MIEITETKPPEAVVRPAAPEIAPRDGFDLTINAGSVPRADVERTPLEHFEGKTLNG